MDVPEVFGGSSEFDAGGPFGPYWGAGPFRACRLHHSPWALCSPEHPRTFRARARRVGRRHPDPRRPRALHHRGPGLYGCHRRLEVEQDWGVDLYTNSYGTCDGLLVYERSGITEAEGEYTGTDFAFELGTWSESVEVEGQHGASSASFSGTNAFPESSYYGSMDVKVSMDYAGTVQ